MNHVTEADFLAVGEKLMGLLSAARDIRSDISRLADSISGDSGEHACRALASVLHRSIEMKERVEGSTRKLGSIRHHADKIRRCFSGFHEIVLSFQVAATLGRIETARLVGSQSGLGHLADEVRSCTTAIRDQVEHALQVAAELEQSVGVAIQNLSDRDFQQLAALPSLVDAIQETLHAFRLRQEQAKATSVSLAGEFAAFSEAISDLVEALQFHDITRQQVEHVIESLDRLLSDGHGHGSTAYPSPHDAAVIDLQREQLLDAAKTFGASVQRVREGLREIARRGSEMEKETKALLGLVGEHQQSSFFCAMESHFRNVLAAAGSCAAVNEDAAGTVGELQRSIARLQASADDLRTIWLQVNRLALNATIEAIHLGPPGEPLTVVAESMQKLYANSEQRSGNTEDSLATLSSEVLSLALTPMQVPGSPVPADNVTDADELRTRIDELHASGERSLACSEQISAVAARLCAEVQSASDSFTVGKLVDQTLDRSCEILHRISGQSDIDPARAARGLEHLTTQYTMRAEREVHEKAMAKAAPLESNNEPACPAIPAPPADLGEGVELF